jgi:hypothetical protein
MLYMKFLNITWPLSLTRFCCLSALAVIASGCSDTTLTRFNVDETLGETTVQGVGFGNILPLTFSELDADIEQQESYGQEDFDYVTEIKMTELTLSIVDASDDPERDSFEDGNEDNFDFLESMTLYIQASIGGEQRKETIALLSADDPQIASSTRQLSLTTTGLDILDYVEADGGYQVIVEGNGNVPSDDVVFNGEVVYRVGVGFR